MWEQLGAAGPVMRRLLKAQPSYISAARKRGTASGQGVKPARPQAHLAAAAEWLRRAQDVTGDGGVAGYFSAWRGWSGSYPETTGYLVPTFLALSLRPEFADFSNRASRAVEFLLGCQLPSGAFPGGQVGRGQPAPSVFNSAQVLGGLVEWHRKTSDARALEAAVRAGDWLVTQQDSVGAWTRHVYLNTATTYTAYASCWLAELGVYANRRAYREAAALHLQWVLGHVDSDTGWIDACGFSPLEHRQRVAFTHTIAYTIAGMLSTARLLGIEEGVDCARRAARAVAGVLGTAGWLPGVLDHCWSPRAAFDCVTGTAQMALIWMDFFETDHDPLWLAVATRAIDEAAYAQELRAGSPAVFGGVPGSDPLWGRYTRLGFPNWAAKFLVDALLEEQRLRD